LLGLRNLHVKDLQEKRILIAVLNWGLGHLMRSIPLIKQLQSQGNQVILAVSEEQKKFFQAELTAVEYLHLAAYPFHFRGKGNFGTDLMLQFFTLHRALKKERKALKNWVEEKVIDCVISDQRLGFYNKKVRSILVSHQLKLALPWYQKLFQVYYSYYLKKFDTIWVPDFPDLEKRLSGKLSESKMKNCLFIGPLSRFQKQTAVKKYAFGALISGPPPYSHQLLQLVVEKFRKTGKPCFVLSSIADSKRMDGVELISYTSTADANELLQSACFLVSRSGYSSIMDFTFLEEKAILIPTPGQYEQVYLAEHLSERFIGLSEQEFIDFDLNTLAIKMD